MKSPAMIIPGAVAIPLLTSACNGRNDVLGNFTTHFNFCADRVGVYGENVMEAYMVDKHRDILFPSATGREK